jgi:hypothetical protein
MNSSKPAALREHVAGAGLDGAFVSVPPPLFGDDATTLNDALAALLGGPLRGLADEAPQRESIFFARGIRRLVVEWDTG